MEEKEKTGLSTAGLVLGIIGACTSFIPLVNNVAFVMGLLAVVFGIISLVKKIKTVKSIIALVLGILTVIIVIVSQQQLSNSLNDLGDELNNITGDNTENILANNVNVSFGKFEVTKSEFYNKTKLVATVKNKTNEAKSYTIQVEAVNSKGSRIDVDYIYVDSLGANKSAEYSLFEYVKSDKIDDFKTSTFKVVDVSMY